MEIEGQLIKKGEIIQVSDSFKKRDIVIKTNEQYPQSILIELHQDKVDLVSKLKKGQNIKVSINIRGREWENKQGEIKYFNTITGWKVEEIQAEVKKEVKTPPPAPVDDDLPF